MKSYLRFWRRPPEPTEARDAARLAAEQHEKARQLATFIAAERKRNHFAERLDTALAHERRGRHAR